MIAGVPPELERILLAGNSAPSGENCQPWHFNVRDKYKIEVHLLPERDQSPYSWGQRASYLANGAAIENMVIAASTVCYGSDVQLFPDPDNEYHVATLSFFPAPAITPDPLADAIAVRVSNRKPYAHDHLNHDERRVLTAAAEGYGQFALVEDAGDIRALGRVGSTNEEVMLANHLLHGFFFSHVNWTKAEDDEKKVGFYIKTLELPPTAEKMFKLFSHWRVMKVLAKLGFNRMVAKQNGAVNAAAAAMGALVIPGTEPIDFVRAGRTIEQLWLTATSLGLSLQPLTGVLFFKLKIDAGEDAVFSPLQKRQILDAYAATAKIAQADAGHVAFMFRLGHGEAPSARAIRFPLSEVIEIS